MEASGAMIWCSVIDFINGMYAPPAGSGAEPQPPTICVHFGLKWKHQVQMILNNVSWISSRKFRAGTGQLVVWLRFRPVDRRFAGSIPDSANFLTRNSSGQATNALVSLFTKQ